MKALKYGIGLCALLWVVGCVKNAEPQAAAAATTPAASNPNRGGIAPMGPNVGGMTPVAGAESVGGAGGGGTGAAAKDMAKRAASGAGAPAGMGQMGSEGGE